MESLMTTFFFSFAISLVKEMKIGSSMKIFVATKRGIKVLGNILIISSMNSIIPQKIKFKYPHG
jgi:hypothetical protein